MLGFFALPVRQVWKLLFFVTQPYSGLKFDNSIKGDTSKGPLTKSLFYTNKIITCTPESLCLEKGYITEIAFHKESDILDRTA
jgi:hypothetical protein